MCISCFYNFRIIGWLIESISLRPFRIDNEKTINCPRANVFSCGLYTLTSAGQHHSCTCLKLGFQPFHNSKGVLGTTFGGTLFNTYKIVFRASLHKNNGRLKLHIILKTMSINVWFYFSATTF